MCHEQHMRLPFLPKFLVQAQSGKRFFVTCLQKMVPLTGTILHLVILISTPPIAQGVIFALAHVVLTEVHGSIKNLKFNKQLKKTEKSFKAVATGYQCFIY